MTRTNYASWSSESFEPSHYAAKSSIPCMNEEECPVTNADIIREIREICNGLALSDRARAARYDKIVEVLKNDEGKEQS